MFLELVKVSALVSTYGELWVRISPKSIVTGLFSVTDGKGNAFLQVCWPIVGKFRTLQNVVSGLTLQTWQDLSWKAN